jgi:hypothetical protein
MSFEPYFHDASASVRFWVPQGDAGIGAIIGREILSYCFRDRVSESDPLKIYAAHREQIHAAVNARVAAGAREPVILKRHDLGIVTA